MNGLDLESFLLLLRADLSVWLLLGFASFGLAFLVWSSWSSQRTLPRLPGSLTRHSPGVGTFWEHIPGIIWSLTPHRRYPNEQSHIREIRVAALVEPAGRRPPEPIASGNTARLKSEDQAKARGPRGTWWMYRWR